MSRTNAAPQSGFTLIEAMLALAVAAILLVVAVPGMSTVYLDNRRTATVNDFFTGLQLARSEAIAKNQRVVVCASKSGLDCAGNWSDGVLVFTDRDRDRTRDADEPVVFALGALELKISSTAFPAALSYRPNGRVMAATIRDNTGDFEFCDHRGSASARTVLIDPSGRPMVAKTNLAGAAPAC